MKKFFLLAVLLVSFGAVNAQETSFGFKGGLNVATLSGDDTGGLDNKLGFHLGGYAELGLSDKFSIQPELLVSTQGTKFETSIFGIDVESTTNLTYLNVPVMLKFYPVEGFSINAGPQLGFLLSAKTKVETLGQEEEEDIKDLIKGTDFGLGFGAEYKTASGLSFHARYNLGLSNLNDVEGNNAENQNAVFQVGVGFGF